MATVIHRNKHSGFTIVELIIVIIVIGILAAIVVAGYAAVRTNARTVTVKSDLTSAQDDITLKQLDGATGGQYPGSLALANLKASPGVTYQYSVDNNRTPRYYCLTGTITDINYYVSSDTSSPQSGTCPGHGSPTIITNLIRNPSVTTLTNFSVTGTPGTPVIRTNADAHSGTTYLRYTLSGSGATEMRYALNTSSLNASLSPNTPYTLSAKIRPSKSMTFTSQYNWIDASSNVFASTPTTVVAPAGSWTTVSIQGQSSDHVTVYMSLFTSGGSTWNSGDYLDVDSLMITEGATVYDYRDGTSAGWTWNGTANNSSSTGPRP